MSTWSGMIHQKYPFVPAWVPSHESIVAAFTSSLDNVKANITMQGKSKKDIAIELALIFVQLSSLLLIIIGLPPLPAPPFLLAQIAGVALMIVGIFYLLASPATLASKLSFMPTPGPGAVLTTEGVFAHCRHPQYFGLVTFGLGLSLISLSPNRLFWTVVMWLALEKKADIEEICMVEAFPEYTDYMKDKPKFIPGRLITGQNVDAPSSPAREGFVDISGVDIAE